MSKLKGDPGYRDGWCIHYRAPSDKVTTCEAGVEYAQFRGPHQPCFLTNGKSRSGALDCPCLRLPTDEEIAAHKEWSDKRMDRFFAVLKAIQPWRQANKGRSHSEVVECAACKGRLHLSIAAYNGHVHGRCETDGCVSWME